jgi:hypothetical protein
MFWCFLGMYWRWIGGGVGYSCCIVLSFEFVCVKSNRMKISWDVLKLGYWYVGSGFSQRNGKSSAWLQKGRQKHDATKQTDFRLQKAAKSNIEHDEANRLQKGANGKHDASKQSTRIYLKCRTTWMSTVTNVTLSFPRSMSGWK